MQPREATRESVVDRPSLEGLVETGMLKLESLHPGGLETTEHLVQLCGIRPGAAVLDVASGTGETACFLAETFGARVFGVDRSEEMIRRARAKAGARGLEVTFENADAAHLPFGDAEFDATICECTLCLLDKPRVLGEMARVVRPGGRVGMHDVYWKEGAPGSLRRTLEEIEGERPETLEGWRRLFERAGLERITAVDESAAMSRWMQESREQLGWTGQLSLVLKIIRRWGLRGAWRVLRSERVFSSDYLGYALVVGTKRRVESQVPTPTGGDRHRVAFGQTPKEALMVMTVLEARVPAERLSDVERVFDDGMSPLPSGIVESYLVRDTEDPGLFRLTTVWRSMEALEAMRRSTVKPKGVQMFEAVGASPTLSVFEVVIHRQEQPGE